jgi:hypothetical protein
MSSGDPDAGEVRGTFGLFGGEPEYAVPAVEITPLAPVHMATDVPRSARFRVRLRDGNLPLEMATLLIRYRQQPYPAESPDGWVDVVTGTTFQPGFDGIASSIELFDYEEGQQATVVVQPLFGLLPGSTGTLEISIEDCDGATITETVSFTVVDDARSVNMRDDFYKFRRQAERYGWEPLVTARQTYDFDVDPEVTGAALTVDVNESLVADFADQLNESPYDLAILNNVRRYRLVAKPIEYPRDSDDAQADQIHDGFVDGSITSPVFTDRKVPGDQHHEDYDDADRVERQFRYYTLFILVPPSAENPDWFWAYADNATFARSFAYGRYGHSSKLYDLMPQAWQVIDGDLP